MSFYHKKKNDIIQNGDAHFRISGDRLAGINSPYRAVNSAAVAGSLLNYLQSLPNTQ